MRTLLGVILIAAAPTAFGASDKWAQRALDTVRGHYKSCGKVLVAKYQEREGNTGERPWWPQGSRGVVYTLLRTPQFNVLADKVSEADRLNGVAWRGAVQYGRPRVTYGLSFGGPIKWEESELEDRFEGTDKGLELLRYPFTQGGPDEAFADIQTQEQSLHADSPVLFSVEALRFVPPESWNCAEVQQLPRFPK